VPERLRLQPWMLVSAAWIVPALLGGLDAAAQQRIWNQPRDVRGVLFTTIDWLLYGAITPFVFLLAGRFPLTRDRLPRRVVFHLCAALVFCTVWAGAGTLVKAVVQPGTFGPSVWRFYQSWVFTTLPFGVAVYLAVVGIEHAARYFVEVRERDAQVARLSMQLAGAQLAALQARVNPHFLFNSLNTVAVLVRDGDRAAATHVVEQLSAVLRRTLSATSAEVPLDAELDLVHQYLAVEQARFSDRLRPEFDIEPGTESALVPSFALQHLVENAIRHGIARRIDSGRVVVSARRDGPMLELTVADDGPGTSHPVSEPAGHGLANTRERLRTLYAGNATLEILPTPRGTIARLRVPLHFGPKSSNAGR
jgi:two-component system, LytTR family, sensor kinase